MVKLQAHVLEGRRNHLKRGIGKDGKWIGTSAWGMLGASWPDTGMSLRTPVSLSLPELTLGLYSAQGSVPGEVYPVILQTDQRPIGKGEKKNVKQLRWGMVGLRWRIDRFGQDGGGTLEEGKSQDREGPGWGEPRAGCRGGRLGEARALVGTPASLE